MSINFYTIHCPKCDVLEAKLNMKKISFSVVDDVNVIQAKGMEVMPMLEVDGELLGFSDAVKWVNAQPNIDMNN